GILAETAPQPEPVPDTQAPVAVPKPSALDVIASMVSAFAARLGALLRRRAVQWLVVALIALIAAGAGRRVAMRNEMNGDWVNLAAGTYLMNMNESGVAVPAFASPDRASQKKLDIRYTERYPRGGSNQLLARKRIWFAGGSLWFESWIRFPFGTGP